MANEKRPDLIDRKALGIGYCNPLVFDKTEYAHGWNCAIEILMKAPTVDAVPVDEIRVDIMSLSLENQEAILNVSICGKPNEVKIPFSKEVVAVVHGRWIWKGGCFHCSNCKTSNDHTPAYCEGCGAKMDGGINK